MQILAALLRTVRRSRHLFLPNPIARPASGAGTWRMDRWLVEPVDAPRETARLRCRFPLVAGLMSIGVLLLSMPAGAGVWTPVAGPSNAHYSAPLITLQNGKVLLPGGAISGGFPHKIVELYDPATNTWSLTGSLATDRKELAAVLLLDGRVLVVGGQFYTSSSIETATAEMYAPSSGTWQSAPSMGTARLWHTATRLADGRVLVTGGTNSAWSVAHSSAEIYDPSTGGWTAAASMSIGRYHHTATLLPSGKVLVVGGRTVSNGIGSYLNSVVLYDPVGNAWSNVGDVGNNRADHTATVINDRPLGTVLIAGGCCDWNDYISTAKRFQELFNGWAWVPTRDMPTLRGGHEATLLPNGKVLVSGGNVTATLLYDSSIDQWTAAGNALAWGRAALLNNGQVLSVAGTSAMMYSSVVGPAITSASIANFTVGSSGTFTVTVSGDPTPTVAMAGALPTGVTFVPATRVLSGTPGVGTVGSYPLVFTASNGTLPNATQNFTLNVGKVNQTITFATLADRPFALAPVALSATASSGLPVTFTSQTPTVCTAAGTEATLVGAGTCTIAANQAGNATYNAAPQATRSFVVAVSVPGVPQAVWAAPGNGRVTLNFNPPASTGGAPIIEYEVQCNPTCGTPTSDGPGVVITGLSNGTSYTMQVRANNATYWGPWSATAGFTPVVPYAVVVVDGNGDGYSDIFFQHTAGATHVWTFPERRAASTSFPGPIR